MTAGVIAVMALAPSMAWAARKPAPPRQDLTKEGVEVNTKNDFNLGPTGARGWMYVKSTGITVGSLTGEARQILITKIDNGSPADGVLQVGDVVLGVEGKLFDDDARKCFGRAITRAEEEKNRGRLKLIVWRGGRKQDVSLKLRVMGSYSDTSPYDCPKAARILEDGYRYLLEHPKAGNRFHMKELALMASGREEFLDEVRKAARSAAPPDLVIDWKTGRTIQLPLDEADRSFADPSGVVITPDGRNAFISHGGTDLVSVIDLASLRNQIDQLDPGRSNRHADRLAYVVYA